jgi:hypothetical protein
LVPLASVIGFLVATVAQFALHGTDEWEQRLLESARLWLVGVQRFIIGSGHIFTPNRVADAIGWPRGNPFQFEVGPASISYGTLGVLASGYGHESWVAAIVAYSIFYLDAAAGHLRELVVRQPRLPGVRGAPTVPDGAAREPLREPSLSRHLLGQSRRSAAAR